MFLRSRQSPHTILLLLAGLGLLLLAACSGGPAGPQIKIDDAWARSSPMAAGNGSVYLTIANHGSEADAFVGASATVSEAVEIHEMVMEGDVMKMRPVAGQRLEIPAGGKVELKPGGLHIMLLGLKEKLEVGKTVEIKLKFEKSGEQTLMVEVRSGEPEGMQMQHN
jgi:hypothetical protein